MEETNAAAVTGRGPGIRLCPGQALGVYKSSKKRHIERGPEDTHLGPGGVLGQRHKAPCLGQMGVRGAARRVSPPVQQALCVQSPPDPGEKSASPLRSRSESEYPVNRSNNGQTLRSSKPLFTPNHSAGRLKINKIVMRKLV